MRYKVSLDLAPQLMTRLIKSAWYRSARAFRRGGRAFRRVLPGNATLLEAYEREIAATDAGISAYHRLCETDGSQAMLRRNVHRLEKGLLMRPRRDLFAVDYIDETVDALERAMNRPDQSGDELCWAADVIRCYFSVTRADPSTDAARALFDELDKSLGPPAGNVPYTRDEADREQCTFESLFALAKRRRSVRWFVPRPVPRELVERAMLVAKEAPSACNRQPCVFRVFDDPNRVQEIAEIPMGAAGYSHQIPMLVVVIGQMRNFFDPRDRHLIYIDGALAGMSFVLALETLGLSSCIINWPDIAEKEQSMRAALNLEPDERPVFLMAVGYADGNGLVARSAKRDMSQLFRFS